MASFLRCTARLLGTNVKLIKQSHYLGITGNNFTRTFCKFSQLEAARKYSDKHEWISVEGNIGRIGISSYAQEALGDIVYVQLPEVGTELDADEECGTLESVKAASELYTPVSGKVTETNSVVEETPSLINSSCYDKGWLFKVDLKDSGELDKLMDEKQYEAYLKEQE